MGWDHSGFVSSRAIGVASKLLLLWPQLSESAPNLDLFGDSAFYIFSGTPIAWGPGKVNAKGRVSYPTGATGGATTFVNTGGLLINGQAKGCIAQPGAAAIGACNTAAATGANLDTANGAATGCVTALGGGSFCNYDTAW